MRAQLALWALAAALPLGAARAELPQAVRECAERNVPARTLRLSVELEAFDRAGGRSESRAKLLGKVLDDGLRRMLFRFDRPLDMRGSALLIIEKPSGPNDLFMYSPEIRKVRRVTGNSGGSMFGTDFSYEDLEHWHGIERRGESRLLREDRIDEHPVYVIERRPDPAAGSVYERVLTFVDRESCVVLRVESYQRGEQPRKVLTVQPDSIVHSNGIAMCTRLRMEDVREGTYTLVRVGKVEVDVSIPDRRFVMTELLRHD